ncbi:hypothetical protein [Streptomyces triticiradicis]|uniref:hypothetical protein n=1 Tax=Streptomyces triticiradicis TaxID=2651189 RepID=UPI001788B66B|nr:hypothetical protein [Streptomyces triticiradicis]
MARFELTDHDRYRIEKAREDLAAAKKIDRGDEQAADRMFGRLEVAVQQLLEMLDEGAA